ncbi:hypothetical protein FRACYDRAFT_246233 [Fragilariopsis cylindrus CCMP1102]|uniref:Uncharacterized protein n=1 Tax=Fragilariopsis cylindrus CCMP1102 TaxID=635003 RepID=A0A1E7EYX3_9STRA|nr:hypothetical protein FRACYDRAFT_246233 [Fragilariopsis cylindrus CCMP1102]|eukprot:OEU11122.1 hypothetical protein FRACYDRAFT_246233 [Fragilariopsis cylindrus CCMP1102]
MWNTFSKKRQSKSLAAQLRGNVNVGNVNAGGNRVNYCDDEEESSSSSGSDDSISRDVPAAPNATNHRTNNDSNDDNDDDSVVQQQVQVQQQRIYNRQRLDACTLFFSDLSFFFGSTMYLWLAVSESSQTKFYGNSYYAGTTIEANSEYSEFLEDQTIFAFNNIFDINDNSNNNNDDFDYDYTSQVSLYMMYGFIASLLFCVTGLFKMCLANSDHWCDRLPYLFMVLASILGMISSSIIRLYPFISNILFCIEIHLFALQAATMVLGRFQTTGTGTGSTPNIITTTTTTPSDGEHLTTITIAATKLKFPWIRFIGGDILFLIATLTGIAVSYLYLLDYIIIGDDNEGEDDSNEDYNNNDNDTTNVSEDYNDTISLYLSIISAGLWWLSSIMYLMETFFNKLLVCQITKEEEEDVDIDHENKSSKSSNRFRFTTRNSNRKTTPTTTNNIYNNQNDDDDDDTGSVISSWTVGPGPKNKEHITKSSLDDIFGLPVHRTKANMTYY